MEILPTNLPELSKPTRDLNFSQKKNEQFFFRMSNLSAVSNFVFCINLFLTDVRVASCGQVGLSLARKCKSCLPKVHGCLKLESDLLGARQAETYG